MAGDIVGSATLGRSATYEYRCCTTLRQTRHPLTQLQFCVPTQRHRRGSAGQQPLVAPAIRLRLREPPQVELRHRRDPQGLRRARRRGDDLPASPLGSEPKPRALRGHHLLHKANSGRFPRVSPMPWTPSHREPGSRTRWSSSSVALPPAWASRRATCPERRGGQPPEAKGAAGGIAVGHIGPQSDATPLKGRFRGLTMQASKRPRPAERSHLQPGLAPDRRQGVVDGTPTGAAGVGR